MLPRSNRIDGATIRTNMPHAKPYRTSWGTVRYAIGSDKRVTIIIPKKIIKNSPDRHRARRRIYGVIESILHQLPPGNYYLFPNRNILTTTPQQLQSQIGEIVTLLSRTK